MINSDYKYIAYIDESGDDGLKKVRPLDANGSSEWLILSAVVISAHRESEPLVWVQDIVSGFKNQRNPFIHFSDLSPAKKAHACTSISQLPSRCFTVASNKKNMRGYRNINAERVPTRNWFYCWMMRLLLERVTHFVKEDSLVRHGKIEKVKIEYSERGGHSYSQMKAYYNWLKDRPLHLPQGPVEWDVLHPDLQEVHKHKERAGLQLADVVASSFFKACDIVQTNGCDPQFAKLLMPRMARHNKLISGYGLKLMPGNLQKAQLSLEQEEIFKFYGYPKYWWAPDSSNSQAFSSTSNGQASW